MMWDCDCGVVPVVNNERRIVGMVTDRDICIASNNALKAIGCASSRRHVSKRCFLQVGR